MVDSVNIKHSRGWEAYIMPDIELSDLKKKDFYPDLEKSAPVLDDTNKTLHPAPISLKRKLIVCLIIETIISLIIYYNYDTLVNIHQLLGPSLLGASTAALAQSINQFSKKKFDFNKICKFIVWGTINGLFTVLWVDMLITRFENLVYRILVDQAIGAPIFQMVFSILNSLWDNGELTASVRVKYIKSLKYSYCYWPFFSIGLFSFIPKTMMFPANCLANLFWNIVLSKLS